MPLKPVFVSFTSNVEYIITLYLNGNYSFCICFQMLSQYNKTEHEIRNLSQKLSDLKQMLLFIVL